MRKTVQHVQRCFGHDQFSVAISTGGSWNGSLSGAYPSSKCSVWLYPHLLYRLNAVLCLHYKLVLVKCCIFQITLLTILQLIYPITHCFLALNLPFKDEENYVASEPVQHIILVQKTMSFQSLLLHSHSTKITVSTKFEYYPSTKNYVVSEPFNKFS